MEKHKRSVKLSTFAKFGIYALAWMVLLSATRSMERNSERMVQEAVFKNNDMIIKVNAAHDLALDNREEISRFAGIVRGTSVVDVPVGVDSTESQQLDSLRAPLTPDK